MILIDINVVMDVVQKREPHAPHSAVVIERVVRGELDAMIPGHAITTLDYLLTRHAGRAFAKRQLEWMLRCFEIGSLDKQGFRLAHSMGWPDFEDAVVAVTAQHFGCTAIVTRDLSGFAASRVPAMHPRELDIDSIHEQIVAAYG